MNQPTVTSQIVSDVLEFACPTHHISSLNVWQRAMHNGDAHNSVVMHDSPIARIADIRYPNSRYPAWWYGVGCMEIVESKRSAGDDHSANIHLISSFFAIRLSLTEHCYYDRSFIVSTHLFFLRCCVVLPLSSAGIMKMTACDGTTITGCVTFTQTPVSTFIVIHFTDVFGP